MQFLTFEPVEEILQGDWILSGRGYSCMSPLAISIKQNQTYLAISIKQNQTYL